MKLVKLFCKSAKNRYPRIFAMRISAIKTGAAKRIMNRMRGNDFAAMVPPFSNCFLRKSLGVALSEEDARKYCGHGEHDVGGHVVEEVKDVHAQYGYMAERGLAIGSKAS